MLSSDGTVLLSWPGDGEGRLWDLASGRPLETFGAERGKGRPMALSPDHRMLAALRDSERVELWDVASGRNLHLLSDRSYWPVLAAAFSPDGRVLATGLEPWPEAYEAYDCRETVQLWDTASGQSLGFLEGDGPGARGPGAVSAVAFSPDGATLAAGARARTITLWSPATGERRRTLRGLDGRIAALAFSAGGGTLASGDDSGTAALWDPADDRKPHKLKGHEGVVGALAFSPDGQYLATGDSEGAIKLWSIWAGGLPLNDLAGHHTPVTALAFLPDGLMLASESEDGAARVWDVLAGREVRRFDP